MRDARTLIYNCNNKLFVLDLVKYYQDNSIKSEDFETSQLENFVEGTMINMFYDYASDVWEISTKSTIGGDVSFFRTSSVNQTKHFAKCSLIVLNF